MALQFPASPIVGQPSGTYEYTDPQGNTIVYTWDGEKWINTGANADLIPDVDNDAQQPGTLDERYVNIPGDHMEGPLEIGPDSTTTKITLDDDGLGEFGGGVKVSGGDWSDVENGIGGTTSVWTAVNSQRILDVLSDPGRLMFQTPGSPARLGYVGNDPGDDILFTVQNGDNTRLSMNNAGGFMFRAPNETQQQYLTHSTGKKLQGQADVTQGAVQHRLDYLDNRVFNYDMFLNNGTNAAVQNVDGVNLTIGGKKTGAASGPMPLKVGIGMENVQTSYDFIRIAGEFPDKDPTDNSYEQSIQNFVAIRGDYNSRLTERGVGILVNDIVGPKNATEDYQELTAFRSNELKPGDTEADHNITIAQINGFKAASDSAEYLNDTFATKAGADIVTGFNSDLPASTNSARAHYNFYAAGNAPNYFAGLVDCNAGVRVQNGTQSSVDYGMIAYADAVGRSLSLNVDNKRSFDISENGTAAIGWDCGRAIPNVGLAVKNLPVVQTTGANVGLVEMVQGLSKWDSTAAKADTVYNFRSGVSDENVGVTSKYTHFGANTVQNVFDDTEDNTQHIGFDARSGIGNKAKLNYGFYSELVALNDPSNPNTNYNFYAAGSAPNYFAGNIDCDGLINGAFSLRMQTDDPAAFQTTYTTDDEGNQVEQQTYVGTTEDLLSIIKDLRARVAALEAAA